MIFAKELEKIPYSNINDVTELIQLFPQEN